MNYLRSIFPEVWIRDKKEILFSKLQKELETAKGRDRVYPALALSYCYWWDEKRENAQQILTTLHDEFPDDLTLKLNVAYISIQSAQYKTALTMLEDLAESEPRNRRQYYDLILPTCNSHWGCDYLAWSDEQSHELTDQSSRTLWILYHASRVLFHTICNCCSEKSNDIGNDST